MTTEQKKKFIVDVAFYGVIAALTVLTVKYVLVWLAPFVAGFLIAYFLRPVVRLIEKWTGGVQRKRTGLFVIGCFYAIVGVLIWLLGLLLVGQISQMVRYLPDFYAGHIQPALLQFNDWATGVIKMLSPDIADTLADTLYNVVGQLASLVTGASSGLISYATALITKVPLILLTLIFTIVCSVFISADYGSICHSILAFVPPNVRTVLEDLRGFIGGTLAKMFQAYFIIFCITFGELSIGLLLLRVEGAFQLAFIIAIFDILPFLGTGGIVLPWALYQLVTGHYPLGVGLLILYAVVTVARNIIEPRVVGMRIGLHPVVTITAMYAGMRIAGFGGFIAAPVVVIFLKYLADKGRLSFPKWKSQEDGVKADGDAC